MASLNSTQRAGSPRSAHRAMRLLRSVSPRRSLAGAVVLTILAAGCMDSLEQQATKDRGKSIIHKTTQDIGKYEPEAGLKVTDSKIDATDPVTAPLSAYRPMIQQISEIQIKHSLDIYQALNGAYPKDYDEFMSKVIKANNIQLPLLPENLAYQYDVENHKLIVVEKNPEGETTPDAEAKPDGPELQPKESGTN